MRPDRLKRGVGYCHHKRLKKTARSEGIREEEAMLESDEDFAQRDYKNRQMYDNLFGSHPNENMPNFNRDDFEIHKSRVVENFRSRYETNYKYWDLDRR